MSCDDLERVTQSGRVGLCKWSEQPSHPQHSAHATRARTQQTGWLRRSSTMARWHTFWCGGTSSRATKLGRRAAARARGNWMCGSRDRAVPRAYICGRWNRRPDADGPECVGERKSSVVKNVFCMAFSFRITVVLGQVGKTQTAVQVKGEPRTFPRTGRKPSWATNETTEAAGNNK